MPENKVDLFLDSGAYSAKTQGAVIDIQEYITFVKKYGEYLTVYANLDVIGDPQKTWNNQKIMEEAGLKPMPTFHFGEPLKWFQRYLNAGYDYIAIGGLVGAGDMIPFLDNLFGNHICNTPDHTPRVKIHGFGLTSLKLMLRYPYYSVDSTSWVMTGRMGSIFMPRCRGGKYIYDENSWKVTVSNKSPTIKDAGKHFSTMSPVEKRIVLEYVHSKGYAMGESRWVEEDQTYTPKENERWSDKKPTDRKKLRRLEIIDVPGISNNYQMRDEMNIVYFLDLEKSMPAWPWPFTVVRDRKGFDI